MQYPFDYLPILRSSTSTSLPFSVSSVFSWKWRKMKNQLQWQQVQVERKHLYVKSAEKIRRNTSALVALYVLVASPVSKLTRNVQPAPARSSSTTSCRCLSSTIIFFYQVSSYCFFKFNLFFQWTIFVCF